MPPLLLPSREVLLRTVADRAAAILQIAVKERGRAMLALSGGATPKLYLPLLDSCYDRWDVTDVRLLDDRWVPVDHPDSNEGLVRGQLPRARLTGLVNAAPSPQEGLSEVEAGLAACPQPWDLALLGMGPDGHIASLFPGTGAAQDPAPFCVAVTEAPLHPRISLSMAALMRFRHLLLIATGKEKLDALTGDSAARLPVSQLAKAGDRLEILWSP